MDFGTINWVGVLGAFAINFLVGLIWFGPKTFIQFGGRHLVKNHQPIQALAAVWA